MAHACAGEACSHDHGDGPEDESKGKWLAPLVDTTRVTCLNERVDGSGRRVFKPYHQRADCKPFVESCEDEDVELLVYVPFTEAVRIRSLCVVPGRGEAFVPRRVRLWVDRDDVDFALAESLKPVQTFDLLPDFRGLVDYPVTASKFNGVTSVTLHFQGSFGGDSMRINTIGFKGEGTGFRRGVVETTYEATAQLKDHLKTGAKEKALGSNGPAF